MTTGKLTVRQRVNGTFDLVVAGNPAGTPPEVIAPEIPNRKDAERLAALWNHGLAAAEAAVYVPRDPSQKMFVMPGRTAGTFDLICGVPDESRSLRVATAQAYDDAAHIAALWNAETDSVRAAQDGTATRWQQMVEAVRAAGVLADMPRGRTCGHNGGADCEWCQAAQAVKAALKGDRL